MYCYNKVYNFFKDPLPAEKWTGVRDAKNEGPMNAQYDMNVYRKFMGDEDSLHLNVYVPEIIPGNVKLPVMVWVHGGAFKTGSGDRTSFGPDYLIQHNVIVVTLNYRLGVLGFLCLNTPEVPGNAGLKDQVMALKWVQKNIEKFGGDKDNVTVFGESAGSVSVHLLMLSPMATGLFNRAIMQSGSALSDWSWQRNPEEAAFVLAEKLGFNSSDKEEVLNYLRKVKPEELSKAIMVGFNILDKYCFIPVIEKRFPNVESFINAKPIDIIKSGKYKRVPFIMGFNSKEAAFFINRIVNGDVDWNKFTKFEELKLDIGSFLPEKFKQATPQTKSAIIEKIKKFYFTPNQHIVEGYIDFKTDDAFFLTTVQSVDLMSRHCKPAFYYEFSYNGNLNLNKKFVVYNYTGSAHADELGYIFKPDYKKMQQALGDEAPRENEISQTDVTIIKRMTTMWTNFAKYG